MCFICVDFASYCKVSAYLVFVAQFVQLCLISSHLSVSIGRRHCLLFFGEILTSSVWQSLWPLVQCNEMIWLVQFVPVCCVNWLDRSRPARTFNLVYPGGRGPAQQHRASLSQCVCTGLSVEVKQVQLWFEIRWFSCRVSAVKMSLSC